MFVQVITGRTEDAEGVRRQMERWDTDLRPGAVGFLGSTAGVADDGRFVALARFESEDAARRNSERPEQGAWWADTEKHLHDVAFRDSEEVLTLLGGGSDEARFVQVMLGHVVDAAKLAVVEHQMSTMEEAMGRERPDILGELIVKHADGTYIDAVYFIDEASARDGEQREMSPEVTAMIGELMAAINIDEYVDLKDPRLA